MHARRAARDSYFPSWDDDAFFAPRGDIAFSDMGAARLFAARVNERDGRAEGERIRPAELAAMALLHSVAHAVVRVYRERSRVGESDVFTRLRASLAGEGGSRAAALTFVNAFPPPAIYNYFQSRGAEPIAIAPERYLELGGEAREEEQLEELILLWVTNQNPAYAPVRAVVSDHDLGPTYQRFVERSRRFFSAESPLGPRGEDLFDVLLAPARAHPDSIFAQLAYVESHWGKELGIDTLPIWRRLGWVRDFQAEEGRWFMQRGPGPGAPSLDAMSFGPVEEEPKHFSDDLDWMPRVVLIAKTVFVWLAQLTKKYGREITRLDQVPDEELSLLASSGFTGLWLIGLFERSRASREIKQMRGDKDAVASAYSLKSYDIAEELGGYAAYEDLRSRASRCGLRLAADMVPNHVGIDGDWVVNHPDWFVSAPRPPFPSYRFGGADLSQDPRVGIFIEEGYWSKTDAAVVFRRHDRQTGEDRFIYHGNDGTSMPWNDTAQLDYTRAEVRHAVVETILHVARMFPIIRFDAAMTLAKRHYKRLWFPFSGANDAIPSRADHAMTQEEFDHVFPVEFWREVVDTVAQRAPDTLLLAEAFWMMEGYFVRSLGMHRVYNSAFMNMLKREENEKYRQTIKNVLSFEPEILKRFVNFMNNPDEETAVAQFGGDDKYFGVCVLMATMPGLPMFGHGQVEGLHEKYGMEYRRPKWDESPNADLVRRHEREIFPILRKRYLFSGVDAFALYDFVTEDGNVDEDVYAYSNRYGNETALVLYNNKWKTTRGRLFGSINRGNVGAELGIADLVGKGEWLIVRDVAKNLEYLRLTREVAEGGLFWQLDAFKYHVFTGFEAVTATREMPYDALATELAGRGVPSIARALVEYRCRPIHTPLAEALAKGHLDYLASGWDPATDAPSREAMFAFEERIRYVADGLSWMIDSGTLAVTEKDGRAVSARDVVDRDAVLKRARERYAAVLDAMPRRTVAALHAALETREARGANPKTATDTHENGARNGSRDATTAPTAATLPTAATAPAAAATAAPIPANARDMVPTAATVTHAKEAEDVAKEEHATAPKQATAGRIDPVRAPRADLDEVSPVRTETRAPDAPLDVELLLAWIEIEATLDLLSMVDPAASRAMLVERWALAIPLVSAFGRSATEADAHRRATLVLLAATLPSGSLREITQTALGDVRGRAFVDVHEANGVAWLVKERFEELVGFIAEREAVLDRVTLADARRHAAEIARAAAAEGYRAERIAANLGSRPVTPSGSSAQPRT